MVWRVERAGGLSVIQFLKEGMDDLAAGKPWPFFDAMAEIRRRRRWFLLTDGNIAAILNGVIVTDYRLQVTYSLAIRKEDNDETEKFKQISVT